VEPGQLIADRFQIVELAAQGGMGDVYRAGDLLTGSHVALKIMSGASAREQERFSREAQVLAELCHPAIVKYVAHGITPMAASYLAMEWLEGEDLGARLATRGLTVAETLGLATRMCQALAAAHAKGVVHRDLKPSNILLQDGDVFRAKLLDFGIARLLDAVRMMTRTGLIIGTPGYMAPEQARGDKAIDARCDVFSLGCVLFECLTGRPAFVGEHVMAVLAKILLEDAPRLRELRSSIPSALDDLVARMLAKNPAERPPSAAAVLAEIEALGPLDASERAPVQTALPEMTASEQRLCCVVLTGQVAGRSEAPTQRDWALQAHAPTLDLSAGLTQTGVLREPEEAPSSERLEAARRAVLPLGARVERLADGSIVAFLATPHEATDQAAQAARCALALRSCLPQVPIALATGRSKTSRHGPIGEVIDRAARLLRAEGASASTSRHTVRVDELTAGLLRGRFEIGGDPNHLELRGERPLADASRLLGKATPFVGRDRELASLRSVLAESVDQSVARVVLVLGPAGAGKTRLKSELLATLEGSSQPMAIWAAKGDPPSAGSPIGILAPALRQALGIVGGEPAELSQARLRDRLSRHGEPEHGPILEFLAELLGIPLATGSVRLAAARQDKLLMGDQMRRAFEELLALECKERPVLLVLEDLHWGDLPSVSFIDAALRHLAECPLVVVALARPEVKTVFPRLWEGRPVVEVSLGGLSKKSSEKLARHVLGDQATDATIRLVVDRAEGNALYLEELIRAVAEGHGTELPPTVLAMVQVRIEGMQAEARRILRAASVFGEVFWKGALVHLLGGAQRTQALTPWLDELVHSEAIVLHRGCRFSSDRALVEEEYAFRHASFREAAYAMLTDEDRCLGHRLAGEWLEDVGERDAVLLAQHFERGGVKERALGWYHRAAEKELEGNDFAAALEQADNAVRCGATEETRGSLRLLQAEAYRWRGELASAERCGLEALTLLPQRDARWYAAAGETATISGKLGHVDWLVEMGQKLFVLGQKGSVSEAHLVASVRTAVQLLFVGKAELAESILAEVQEAGRATTNVATLAWLYRGRAMRALYHGAIGEHLALVEKTAAYLAELGDFRNACLNQSNLAAACLEVGAYPRAETVLTEVLEVSERLGIHHVTPVAEQNLCMALAHQGRLGEARVMAQTALDEAQRHGDQRVTGGAHAYHAIVLKLQGDLGAAEDSARQAVALLAVAPPLRTFALTVLADGLLAQGRVAEAATCAEEAMEELVSGGGIEEGEFLLRLVHAQVRWALGDRAAARSSLRRAKERIQTVTDRIDDPDLRASFLAIAEVARTLELERRWERDGVET
jgi:tetratricopeptide (TPR) repeat protein